MDLQLKSPNYTAKGIIGQTWEFLGKRVLLAKATVRGLDRMGTRLIKVAAGW